MKEAVSVAQATNDACLLPERVQEALGQLVGAAKEGPRRLRRLPRSARIARLRSPAVVLSGRDTEIESCEAVWVEESIDLGDLPVGYGEGKTRPRAPPARRSREAATTSRSMHAYTHRLGSFCIDGSPVALAAIPAIDRTAIALTQEQLLDVAARLVLGPDARAEDLVRAIFEDFAAVTARAAKTVWPRSRQLRSNWTPFPALEPS